MKTPLSIVALLVGCAISPGAFAGFGDVDPTFARFFGGCGAIEPLENGGAYVDVRSESQRVVARLDKHGALDASWGVNGTLSYGGPSFPGITSLLRGKAGDLFIIDGSGVVHLDATGHVDSSFGNGGRTELGLIHSAALQAGSRLVALVSDANTNATPLQPPFHFVRLTAAGAFDSSFGTFGELHVSAPLDGFVNIYGWAVRGDGSVELGTYQGFADTVPPVLSLVLVSADSSFSPLSPGRIVPQGVASWMSPLAKAEPTGAFAFAGPVAKLSRYNADGSVDSTFGSNGTVSFRSETFAFAESLWREPAGSWTVLGVGGHTSGFFGTGTDMLRAHRFSASGVPDGTFGEKIINDDLHVFAHAPDGSLLHVDRTCALHRFSTDAARVENTVVEYYEPDLDHYFMTSSANEIADLDSNAQPGWIRTGESFGAWSPGTLPGAAHVCRFYGDPVIGPNSHFYTGEDFECQGLIAMDAATPRGRPAWHLESKPFDIAIPVNGACPPNLQPVYRVFNGIVGPVNGPNHRYMTDPAIYAAMQAKGWGAEGVHFCAPPRFN